MLHLAADHSLYAVTFPSSSWAPLARTTVGAALAPGSLVEIEAAARSVCR
jgi:hypothetical protein